jgi:GT2 family glycosyltransferase
MSQTAIVILNYNGQDLLKQFLPSVLVFSKNARIIVADNKSIDNSVAVVKHHFSTIELIEIPENRGYCGGYNYALKEITEKYCVLVNSDIEVTENWLQPMIDLLEKDETIGAVQPKILSYHDKTSFEYAGAAGGEIDILGYPFCRGRIFNQLEKDEGQYNISEQIFWASGACFIVRTDLFRKLGGLDEDFFAHMEEIDFCWKLNRCGFKVFYCHDSVVYHVGGGTLAKSNPKKTYLNFRNGLSLIFKHWSLTELILKLPIRISLDWLAAAKFLLADKSYGDSKAVCKAHFHFFQNLKKDLIKRAYINANFPPKDHLPFFKKSIVLEFYLLGKKKFSELLKA